MPQLTSAEVNARLTILAGGKHNPEMPMDICWTWPSGAMRDEPVRYCSSLDLLRRDVLPLLEKFGACGDKMYDWLSDRYNAYSVLLAPADVIARTALSALEGEEARNAE